MDIPSICPPVIIPQNHQDVWPLGCDWRCQALLKATIVLCAETLWYDPGGRRCDYGKKRQPAQEKQHLNGFLSQSVKNY